MFAMSAAVVFILLGFILAMLLYTGGRPQNTGKRKSSYTKRKATLERARHRFRGVSLVCDESACEGVRALEKMRYLVGEAPLVPIPACTSPRCTCKYAHHEDRREGERDRRHPQSDTAPHTTEPFKIERREKRGRRATDWLIPQTL